MCFPSEIFITGRVIYVIQILIKFIHDIDSIIVDGTEVRKMKGHIRCEVVMEKGRYKMIRYVEVGKRYS